MGRKRKVKDKRIDTGIEVCGGGREEERWAVFPPALLCVPRALQVNGGWMGGGWVRGWGEGPKNFKTLHLHEFDRPLDSTRATFEKATPHKVKWLPRGHSTYADVLKHTPTPPLKLWRLRDITVETLS